MMCTERLLVLLYECLEHWEIREKEKRKENKQMWSECPQELPLKKYTIGDGGLELKIFSLEKLGDVN